MKTVKKLQVAELLDGLYFSTIITSLYAIFHGISLSQVAFAQAFYSINLVIMEVPTGIIADRYSRKLSVALGYFMSALGILSMVISPSVFTLYLMRFFQSTGSALISGASEALLYEASAEEGKEYKKESSIVTSNGIFGLAISGLVAGLTFQKYQSQSFVPLLLLTAGIQLFAAALVMSIKEGKVTNKEHEIMAEKNSIFDMLIETYRLMKTNSTIFALTAFGFLAACNEYFLYQTYGPYLKSFDVSNFWVGAVFSLGLLLNFVVVRNIYKAEKYFTLEKLLAYIKFLAAVGYLLIALVTHSVMLPLLIILLIGVFNIEKPIISDFTNHELSNKLRATVLSGMSLISRLSKAALTIVAGIIIGNNSLSIAYALMGVYLVIGTAVGYWLLVRCGCVRRVVHVE